MDSQSWTAQKGKFDIPEEVTKRLKYKVTLHFLTGKTTVVLCEGYCLDADGIATLQYVLADTSQRGRAVAVPDMYKWTFHPWVKCLNAQAVIIPLKQAVDATDLTEEGDGG